MKPISEYTDDDLHDAYIAMRTPGTDLRLLAAEVLRLRAELSEEKDAYSEMRDAYLGRVTAVETERDEALRKAVIEEDIDDVLIVEHDGETRRLYGSDGGYVLQFSKDRQGRRLIINQVKAPCRATYNLGRSGVATCQEPIHDRTIRHCAPVHGGGELYWEGE